MRDVTVFCGNGRYQSQVGETFDLRRKSNKLPQGTPSLILATPDRFCGTENWPLYPPQPRGCLVNSYSTKPSHKSTTQHNCTTFKESLLQSKQCC